MVSSLRGGQENLTRRWAPPPKARDVPNLRDELCRAWGPRGTLRRITPALEAITPSGTSFVPDFERYTLEDAALWFVGADMCDLLVQAATQLADDVPLSVDLIPDKAGLVVFEAALAGLDAENLGLGAVAVGAMLWGPSLWAGAPAGTQILGITCYGPNEPPLSTLIPLGSLIWALGRTTDDPMHDMIDSDGGSPRLTDEQCASMAEDRRRLLALWFLSTQPGLATTTQHVDRAVARRAERAGQAVPSVRVVQLRQRPPQRAVRRRHCRPHLPAPLDRQRPLAQPGSRTWLVGASTDIYQPLPERTGGRAIDTDTESEVLGEVTKLAPHPHTRYAKGRGGMWDLVVEHSPVITGNCDEACRWRAEVVGGRLDPATAIEHVRQRLLMALAVNPPEGV